MTSEGALAGAGERLLSFCAVDKAVFFRVDRASGRVVEVFGDADTILGFERADWLAPGFMTSRVLRSDREALERVGDWRPGILEVRLVRADGSVVWVERTLSGRDGDDPLLDGLLVDIDARVLRELAILWASTAMREALMSTQQEIARPMNAMSDFAALMERHLAAQGDDVGSDYALGIREGIERLRALADRLTLASRQGGGR